MLIVPHAFGLSELLGQIRISKSYIFSLFLVLSCDSPVSSIFPDIVFLFHELNEVCRIGIGLELLKDLIEVRLILVLPIVCVNAHIYFHLRVERAHVVTHFVHHEVVSLRLNCILIIFQLSGEKISLSVLKLHRLLLLLRFRDQAFRNGLDHATICDLVRVHKPHVVTVVSDKLSVHLKDFNPAHFLEIVANL